MTLLKRALIVIGVCMFATPLLAGTWTRENGLAGMDFVSLYVPTTTPAVGGKRALMINLHGCVQSADDFKNGNNWESVADQFGMVVAIPDVPGNGAADVRSDVFVGQCWDYYFTKHTRNKRFNDNILELVDKLLGRNALNIDPRQVFISGLSSGGGETMVMGCLAPDVFAGIGINAGPTVGTGPNQISSVATNKNAAVNDCIRLAGGQSSSFGNQITSIVFGDRDFTVSQGYNTLNAEVMAEIYDASKDSGSNGIAGGGTEETWSKGGVQVVQLIEVSGLGHAWPAGRNTSGGGGFIDHRSIDYPQLLTKFLFCNNRRLDERVCDGGSDGDDGDDGGPINGSSECKDFTSNNWMHIYQGRATFCLGNACAVGSGDNLGLANLFVTSTVAETSPGFFEEGSCP
ncbi:MAG: extracellular catalytic domain type 1 short-chain-length polyhydroxyalkanoate depolymerase [Gammaproteobacteria bacterium]